MSLFDPRSAADLRRNPAAWTGAAIILLLVAAAALADLLTPYSPLQISPHTELTHPAPPSAKHWLGTDQLGRDMLTRVVHGGRYSLSIGLVSVAVALLIGVPTGAVAGYVGGWVDVVFMRLIDILMAIPSILLAIAIVGALGPSLRNVVISVGIVNIPLFARQIRAGVLSLRELEFVEASRALGAATPRIIWRDILPNSLGPIMVLSTLGIGSAILSIAGLTFLGLGGEPDIPEWGMMLNSARRFFLDKPWVIAPSGVAITLSVLAFNLLGDALRDAFDPRLKR